MGAVLGIILLFGGATASAPVAGYEVHRGGDKLACKSLVERLCRETTADMCRTIERERARRPISPTEETQCRRVLDNPDQLRELVERLRRS